MGIDVADRAIVQSDFVFLLGRYLIVLPRGIMCCEQAGTTETHKVIYRRTTCSGDTSRNSLLIREVFNHSIGKLFQTLFANVSFASSISLMDESPMV